MPTGLLGKVSERLVHFRSAFQGATSRVTDDNEARLFFALDNENKGSVAASELRRALLDAGLDPSDERLAQVFSVLGQRKDRLILKGGFREIFGSAGTLLERALQGNLVIPDFQEFRRIADSIYEEVEDDCGGEQAQYIPPLAQVDPDQFGVAIVTTDGQVYERGDCGVDFSIQSMCKPFNYCFAVEELGEEIVHEHVGNEPSGRSFNDRDLMARFRSSSTDHEREVVEIPYNPMINAGAIMSAALVKSHRPFNERLHHIRNEWAKLIGGAEAAADEEEAANCMPRFNREMARQENFTGFNNFALGYLLMATGKLPSIPREITVDTSGDDDTDFDFIQEPAVADALKLYFSACSLEMNAHEMAMAAATLANGGVCPTTQVRALKQSTVRSCLSVTQMCGMYDGSGDFFFKIGLPAKSGVGGGLILVVPKLMGICIFSPRLDAQGNSVRGVAFAKKLVERTRLHLYDGVMTDTERIDPRVPIAHWSAQSISEALWASSRGDVRTLSRLNQEQFDLEAGDYDKRTAMHLAAAEGHAHVVEFLLQRGIQPRLDRWGGHPISDALSLGHDSVVRAFQDAGHEGAAPSHPVDESNTHHDAGADYNDDLAVIELLFAAAQNNVVGIKRLVARGVPVHAQDYDQRTALHLAACEGSLDAMRYLVAHGHPLHVRDRWFATPLDEALREGQEEAAEFLRSAAH
jgi:glutaminase